MKIFLDKIKLSFIIIITLFFSISYPEIVAMASEDEKQEIEEKLQTKERERVKKRTEINKRTEVSTKETKEVSVKQKQETKREKKEKRKERGEESITQPEGSNVEGKEGERKKRRKLRKEESATKSTNASEEPKIEKNKEEEEKESKDSPAKQIINKMMEDEAYIRNIGQIIVKREQDKEQLNNEVRAKHGPVSFKIWEKMKQGSSWSEKKAALSEEDEEKLKELFGDVDIASKNMKRDTFILAAKLILDNPAGKAINVIKKGAIELVEDHPSRTRYPYSIKFYIQENQATGTLYTKDSNNEVPPQKVNNIYLTINITDIVESIERSNKTAWQKRRDDWNKKQNGRVTTLTPTEKDQTK